MFTAVQSLCSPITWLPRAGQGQHKGPQAFPVGVHTNEMQLPAVTREGLGRAPHPLIPLLLPLQLPSSNRLVCESSTLHCNLSSPYTIDPRMTRKAAKRSRESSPGRGKLGHFLLPEPVLLCMHSLLNRKHWPRIIIFEELKSCS